MGIFKSPKMCRLYSVYCTVEKSEILSQECDKIFRDTCQLNTLDLWSQLELNNEKRKYDSRYYHLVFLGTLGNDKRRKTGMSKDTFFASFFSSSIGLLTKTTEQKWDEEEKKEKELKNV